MIRPRTARFLLQSDFLQQELLSGRLGMLSMPRRDRTADLARFLGFWHEPRLSPNDNVNRGIRIFGQITACDFSGRVLGDELNRLGQRSQTL
jgi:hypothetical protein